MRRNRNQNFQNKLMDSTIQKIEKKATDKTLTAQIATRQTSQDFFNTIMGSLPNPDPVLQKMGKSIEIYEDLMYDSRVIATTTSRKAAILAMEWRITGDKSTEVEKQFYTDIFNKYKMKDVISEMLDAPLFGYKPTEILWGESNGKIIPAEFIGKPARWFTYDSENKLRFLSSSNYISGVLVPEDCFVVVRKSPTYDNPFGKAALSSCFWPVTFRKSGLKFWTIFLEKYGMPFLTATAEPGATTERMEEIAEMLNDMVADAVAVVPDAYNLQIQEAKQGKGSGDSMHKTYLDFMNIEIAMSIVGTNLTTEVQGGSLAASQSHMEVRKDIIESDQCLVHDGFNELIAKTHAMNFSSPAPKFELYSREGINIEKADRDEKLTRQGVRFTKKYYQNHYNLEEDDFEIEDTAEETKTETKPKIEDSSDDGK